MLMDTNAKVLPRITTISGSMHCHMKVIASWILEAIEQTIEMRFLKA